MKLPDAAANDDNDAVVLFQQQRCPSRAGHSVWVVG